MTTQKTVVAPSGRPSTGGSGQQRPTHRQWLVADLVAKFVLAVLLGFSVTHRDWDRFADKAMLARAVVYPLLVAGVPLAWYARGLPWPRGGRAYPSQIAFLVTVPFVVDVAGNALDLYDRIDVFDDVCHFVNWAVLSAAFGIACLRAHRLPAWIVAALCTGFGAVTAILWEIGEYGAFITTTPERFTLYRDTIGDLTLGLAGSLLAGACCAIAARRAAGNRSTGLPPYSH